MALEPGQILDGKYRVGRLIGEGGMGTVYEGENSRIGRRVAIKVLHAQVAALPEFVERFEREARAAARIGSQHVCDVLDLGDLPNGDRYIVMEYLDGVSLEDRLLAEGKLSAAELAPIAFELLEGLGTMHLARVVHRDLKPANIFLARLASRRGETVKILDFGVAKLQPFEGEVGTMTQTGTMMGTPLYMSPEQARGARDVDGRTDIYAASVIFYRALAGVLPYTADALNELLFKIVLEDPRPLRDIAPEVDPVFASIVHKGLSRDVEQRFQTAREYQEAIAAWGKTQGRSSLSFAVTMPSAPPGPPSTPPEVARLAVTTGTPSSSDGTPTAWSEDGPEVARAASSNNRIGEARPGPGQSDTDLPVASTQTEAGDAEAIARAATPARAEIGDLGVSPSASTVAVKSSPPDQSSAGHPEASGGESAGVGEQRASELAVGLADARLPAVASDHRSAEKRAPRAAIGVGAGVALAIAAFFAFGNGSGAPREDGRTPTATAQPASSPATDAVAPSPVEPPTGSSAPVAAESPDAAATAEPPQIATTPTTKPPTTVRRSDTRPAPPRDLAPAVTLATSAVASVAPPIPPNAPKPASSGARKFRTNLD